MLLHLTISNYNKKTITVVGFAHLVGSQDLERGHHLLGCVRLGCLASHEVDEGLEGDHACIVGVHQSHDAGKLHLTLCHGNKLC